jgi:hypothetical protein
MVGLPCVYLRLCVASTCQFCLCGCIMYVSVGPTGHILEFLQSILARGSHPSIHPDTRVPPFGLDLPCGFHPSGRPAMRVPSTCHVGPTCYTLEFLQTNLTRGSHASARPDTWVPPVSPSWHVGPTCWAQPAMRVPLTWHTGLYTPHLAKQWNKNCPCGVLNPPPLHPAVVQGTTPPAHQTTCHRNTSKN